MVCLSDERIANDRLVDRSIIPSPWCARRTSPRTEIAISLATVAARIACHDTLVRRQLCQRFAAFGAPYIEPTRGALAALLSWRAPVRASCALTLRSRVRGNVRFACVGVHRMRYRLMLPSSGACVCDRSPGAYPAVARQGGRDRLSWRAGRLGVLRLRRNVQIEERPVGGPPPRSAAVQNQVSSHFTGDRVLPVDAREPTPACWSGLKRAQSPSAPIAARSPVARYEARLAAAQRSP
jgi:hypothetical protein